MGLTTIVSVALLIMVSWTVLAWTNELQKYQYLKDKGWQLFGDEYIYYGRKRTAVISSVQIRKMSFNDLIKFHTKIKREV